MAVPLTLCIIVLCALIGVLTWLLVRSQRRYDDLVARHIAASDAYAGTAIKTAAEQARNQPKYAEKMLDSLARGITQVTDGISASMKTIYGPIQSSYEDTAASKSDLPTPWYAEEGSMDYSDPTDGFLGGIADPLADNQQVPGGNLILEDGPAGFGLPEGAFD